MGQDRVIEIKTMIDYKQSVRRSGHPEIVVESLVLMPRIGSVSR